jgi:hypothetical protein
MHALYQRLRELDWDTFQRLGQQLLAARHPTFEIKHVHGAGGDKGLDSFNGTLAGGPNIWQCKHFPNGLKAKQRPQVVKSLDDAVTNFHPQNWILVISIDLDTPGHEWFQGLQKDYQRIRERMRRRCSEPDSLNADRIAVFRPNAGDRRDLNSRF